MFHGRSKMQLGPQIGAQASVDSIEAERFVDRTEGLGMFKSVHSGTSASTSAYFRRISSCTTHIVFNRSVVISQYQTTKQLYRKAMCSVSFFIHTHTYIYILIYIYISGPAV